MGGGAEFIPRIVGLVCNWCCYGGADLCGVSRFQYPPFIRLIRVMCSGRVDPAHVFRAFVNRFDAVFIGGCHLNDCHYVTNGNYDALAMARTCQKLMEKIGLNPERLRLEWVSAGEGIRFANIMNEFGPRVQKLGPLGASERLAEPELGRRLEAVTRILPYVRLVLAEKLGAPRRLRAAADPQGAHEEYYAGGEFARLFDETVGTELALSRILLLLREGPRTAGEIAGALGLTPSEAARHMSRSSRLGLVRFDAQRRRFREAWER